MALYDPNEFPRTDFTLGEILNYARSKPSDEAYDYRDHHNCVVARFLRDTGRAEFPRVAWNTWRDGPGDTHSFPKRVWVAAEQSGTFGEFGDRLEKALAR